MKIVTDSLEQFRATVLWQNRMLAMFGIYLYAGAHRFTLHTAFTCFIPSSFIVLSLYSIVRTWGSMSELAISLVAIFYAIIAMVRLAVALSNPAGCYQSLRLAEQVYLDAAREDAAQQSVLTKYTRLLRYSATVYMIVFALGIVMVMLMPFGFYLFVGQRFLPLGMLLPFVDPETPSGYWGTLVFQIFYIASPIPLIASQNIYFAFIFNICIQYELLIIRLEDLNATIRNARRSEGEGDSSEVHEKLVKIIQSQQSCTAYIVHIEQLYRLQSFIEFLCNFFQLAVTLTELSRSFWLPGLFILPVAVVQMLILCFLGTLIELRSDQFIDKLYDIAWSEMGREEQAMFKFVLQSAQNPVQLTCADFVVINMNLFMSISKKIYSLFMMLQNFSD